jgi:hypothetical protein
LLKKRQKIEKESDLKIEKMLSRGDIPTLDQ